MPADGQDHGPIETFARTGSLGWLLIAWFLAPLFLAIFLKYLDGPLPFLDIFVIHGPGDAPVIAVEGIDAPIHLDFFVFDLHLLTGVSSGTSFHP